MAILNNTWYCNGGDGSTTGYWAVAQWTALHAYTAGTFVRQANTAAAGSERLFVCIIAGTSLASEPSWTLTQGAKTAEAAGPTWMECTGKPATCGDLTNSQTTATTRSKAITQGEVIYDSGTASVQICTTAGTSGAGTPSFSTTAGTTTADTGATWTSLGLASTYTAWLYPWGRMSLALATGFYVLTGHQVFVSSAHTETQASAISYNAFTTSGATISILSVNSASAPPTTVAAGAAISTTGNNIATIGGQFYMYGFSITSGSGANSVNLLTAVSNTHSNYETCTFTTGGSTGGTMTVITTSGNVYRGCSFIYSATGSGVASMTGEGYFFGCTFAGSGSIPTSLFASFGNGTIYFMDCNFSAVTGTLIAHSGSTANQGDLYLSNSKLGSGVTVVSYSGNQNYTQGSELHMSNCDSTSTNYRYLFSNSVGSVQHETTIVRTGSLATDGTTPISWNFTTTASPTYYFPFISEEISIWNDVTGSVVTATFYLISNTTLNNNDFWAEVEYAGTSSFPLGLTVNSRMTPLGTPTALTSDSSTWGGSTNKYKIVLTFAPQNKGPVKARFYAAKPSVTTYLDNYIYLS